MFRMRVDEGMVVGGQNGMNSSKGIKHCVFHACISYVHHKSWSKQRYYMRERTDYNDEDLGYTKCLIRRNTTVCARSTG